MSMHWVVSSLGSNLPENALRGGTDSDLSPIYVGRTTYEGDQVPAKVIPSRRAAYISYESKEIFIHNYEVLCGTGFSWISSSNGSVPSKAVVCGKSIGGETLYIGRVHYEGSLTIGKIIRSNGCIFFPYDKREIKKTNYDVLVHQPKLQWIMATSNTPVPAGAIIGGHDSDGELIYVGRAIFNNDKIPGKVIPKNKAAYVAYKGSEHVVNNYEVLCHGNFLWKQYCGRIPINAFEGGKTESGEQLYIGRGTYAGNLTVGKVQPTHNCLYITYDGFEISLQNFEILVEN